MSIVYVPQLPHRFDRESGELYPAHDITPAERFGEIQVILTPSANPFTSMSGIVEDLRNAMSHYSDKDYLLLVGNPAIIGVTAALAAEYNDGRLRLLQWNGRDKCYNPIEVNLD